MASKKNSCLLRFEDGGMCSIHYSFGVDWIVVRVVLVCFISLIGPSRSSRERSTWGISTVMGFETQNMRPFLTSKTPKKNKNPDIEA